MELIQNKLAHIKTTFTVTKAKDLPNGQFEAVLSTDDLDRHGEIVSIKGLQVPNNQVIKMYYNHETNGTALPIGQWTKIWKSKDGKLMGRGQIDLLDDFEIKIDKKIKLGTLDSISIGFYPLEYDGDTSTWTKSNLVEASVVAEPANVNARVTQKELGFTEDEFEKSLTVKMKEVESVQTAKVQPAKMSSEQVKAFSDMLTKGGVADVLAQQDKCEEMEDFWEVVYAFSEAYYSPDAKVTDFNTLLAECIKILQTIVDGSYAYEDEDETPSDASGAGFDTEMKTAIEDLKSKVGALEAADKAANESPATVNIIKVRMTAKQVDKAIEGINKHLRIKLQETN